ncbi:MULTISPECIES: hypothetical protein [Sutcliffiella]|uniref:hypothetical protein n=1 Tax=Sutcliffiella TaxID=2837511 RepID=UPI000A58DCB2|nr:MULTISPECIES: hypothetical protein [Sutcliffiella]WBL15782.1 hypothetical protein O1A01_03780 [Sutcliffiella sp. NC1]
MEKENNELQQSIKDNETLEISSTGYGLESVSHDEKENKQENQNPSSCGGL